MQTVGRIAGTGTDALALWSRLSAAHRDLIPPYPGAGVIPLVVTPTPPEMVPLPEGYTPDGWLVACYRGAWRKVYVRPCALGPSSPARVRAMLAPLGAALAERRIPPGVWFVWLFRQWAEKVGRGATGPAPIQWSLKAENVERWRGWFWGTETARGGTGHLTPSHANLLRRWSAARAALLDAARRVPELPASRVARIMREHLPDGLYEALVEDGRREAADELAELTTRVSRGEYLW